MTTHLEGYIYSQEHCSHIGKLHYYSSPELEVSKIYTSGRMPSVYDIAICDNCGQLLQLQWIKINEEDIVTYMTGSTKRA